MRLAPVAFADFSGGLNLRDKADVVSDSEAIDLLNVEFTERGAIKQRAGYVKFTSSALTNRVDSLAPFQTSAGTKQLLAGCGTRLEALSTAGGVVASATGLATGPWGFAQIAVPGSDLAYAGNGTDTLRKWDGAAWSAPTATVDGVAALAMPKGRVLATTASGRLLVSGFSTTTGGPNGAATNSARVYFSNPGAPEAYTSTNWIDLDPGDGDPIMGAVRWSNLTFVFKSRKFYVFTGEGTDVTGGAIFNYRPVDTQNVGLAAFRSIAVAPEGVYFMDRTGVYLTTGDAPTLVSDKISPIWRGNPEVYYQSNTFNFAQIALCRLTWHDRRVYLAFPSGTSTSNDRMLVYDTRAGWWTLHDIPASAMASFLRSDPAELHFGYATGTNDIGRVSTTATDDAGTAITSRWRSGWSDYGTQEVKVFPRTKVWVTGGLTTSLSRDYQRSSLQTGTLSLGGTDTWGDGTGTDTWGDGTGTDTWGGAGQVAAGTLRKTIRGTVLSTSFSNLAGTASWSVHRVTRYMRSTLASARND
jgi:hypothetical protein